jgi:hypothetical protein
MLFTQTRRFSSEAAAACSGVAGGTLLTAAICRTSPVAGSLALLGAIVAGFIFLVPDLGLLLTAIVIPIERLGRFTNDQSAYTVSLMRIVGMLTLSAFLVHTALRRRKLVFAAPIGMYLIYWFYGLLTLSWTNDSLGGIRAASAMLGNLLFLFVVVNMARDWKILRRLLVLWLAASIAIGVYTAYAWHTGRHNMDEVEMGSTSERFSTVLKDNSEWESLDQVERALGPTSSPAVYAINMIMTLPFLFFLYRTRPTPWERSGLALCMLIVLYNIFLTNTRAAIIVAGLTILMCFWKRMVPLNATVIVSGLFILGIALAVTPPAVYHRVLDISNYSTGRSGTLRARLVYWSAGVDIAKEYWYKGTGIGNQAMVPKYAKIPGPEFSSVHNEYLNTFLETGLFGWLLFFSFAGLLLVGATRTAQWFRKWTETQEQYWFMVACQITMVAVLMFAFQVDVFHFPLKGWWLVASMTIVMQQTAAHMRRNESAPYAQQLLTA